MKFPIQFLTFLLLVKYSFFASGNHVPESSSSQVSLDQLRQEFETIRSTLAKIDSRVTGSDSGPTVDVSEWFDTITSLTRQLPFLRTLLERATNHVQTIGSRLGISGREESVVQLREAIKSWTESLQRLNATLERLSQTYGTYTSDIASSTSVNDEISKQEDIQLPLLSIALSDFIEATTILRNRIGTVLNVMVRTTGNAMIPAVMSGEVGIDATNNEIGKDGEGGTIVPKPLNSSRGIDLTITVNEIRRQLAKVTELLAENTSNFILQVTRRRASNRNKSRDQIRKEEADALKGLDAMSFISREFNEIREFASKLSQG